MIVTTLLVFNFLFSFLVTKSKLYLAFIILVNILVLFIFKYESFFISGVAGYDLFTADIIIPLGISFYVFQMTGYQIDLAKGRCSVQRDPIRFVIFVMFFPQLIAGPIVRAQNFMPQIDNLARIRKRSLKSTMLPSLALILLGLVKKIYFADSLAPHVNDIFARGPEDAQTAILGAWLFAFQIYFDFSGYSDMAVGMARLFGIRLPMNFFQPYLSRSPREFWQRWHVTLSQWILNYLYLPLGGNKGPWARAFAVLLITMGLAGLWHGANWTFIIWGLGWGLVVFLYRQIGQYLATIPLAGWLVTFSLTLGLWVFFRSPDLHFALSYFQTMGGGAPTGDWAVSFNGWNGIFIIMGCLSLLILHFAESKLFRAPVARILARRDGLFWQGVVIALILWLVLLPDLNGNPFIYFRF
ncbi:MAG: hypothetical protein P1V34_05145 [Alphaproteobacteria bacterium]|nr:hypothetical protein [Alphaproteobacteria bacterium]